MIHNLKNFWVIALTGLLCCLSLEGKTDKTSPVEIHLVADHPSVTPGNPTWIAVQLKMEKGWHVYWKNPGDVGIPLQVEWILPQGFEMGPLQWPTPKKFSLEGLVGFGYDDEVTLLSQLNLPKDVAAQQIEIQAKVTWLACSSTTCLPGSAHLKLPLSVSLEHLQTDKDSPTIFKEAIAKIAHESDEEIISFLTSDPRVPQASLISLEGAPAGSSHEVLWALVFAFIGGMILNLMPCVLPVISFKIMSFVKMAGQNRSLTLKHGCVFSLGVLASFWALASVMLVLRSYGETVGWGFQLQQPLFVAILASLLFVFALSLFGLFEIGLSVASWAGQTESDTNAKLPGYTSSFFSGVLATAVATPCTGPFLGSAVGFAVTLPVFQAMSIFTSLALGLCAPYLLLSAFPSWLRFIPRPGAWMEVFKQLMAFLLLATVLWLLWVFSAQTDAFSLICLLAGFLCFSIGGWIYSKGCTPFAKKKTKICAYACIALFAWMGCEAILFPSASWNLQTSNDKTVADAWEGWEEFSPKRVAELRSMGKPVLIDFTAKWCLICQANHMVLSSGEVKDHLAQAGVVRMKADWTKNDPVITEELAKFGRNSVPLYVLYGVDEKPQILPQVLTPDVVAEHLQQAANSEEIALRDPVRVR